MLLYPRRAGVILKSVLGHEYSQPELINLVSRGHIKTRGPFGKRQLKFLEEFVYPGEDIFHIKRKLQTPSEKVVAFWKPTGINSEMHGGLPDQTYFKETSKAISKTDYYTPVGRLDVDTSGIILLTTSINGPLEQILCSKKTPKTYIVTFDEEKTVEHLQNGVDKLKRGIRLKEGKIQLKNVEILQESTKNRLAIRVEVNVGYNRVVRRMFREVMLEVKTLHREKFGPVGLGRLHFPGDHRFLTDGELEKLWSLGGGFENWRDAEIQKLRSFEHKSKRLEEWLSSAPNLSEIV